MFAASLAARTGSESAAANPVLFQGYYFRVLATRPTTGDTMTPGIALVAYPADYRSSGVMTFMVTNNDVVYEKDLGPKSSALASATTTFHKDATWHVADE
jgi:hypothetical protein